MLRTYNPQPHSRSRVLALYSAAIAVADDALLDSVVSLGNRVNIKRGSFYEIVLQSYLFLGFPRMLNAAEHLDRKIPNNNSKSMLEPISADESQSLFNRGVDLCHRVYSDKYELLKDRVESFAPDIFRWMVLEGYGKVLSRPGVNSIDRELAVIACLMVENRKKQLASHIRGAFNVGSNRELIEQVIEDIAPLAPQGYQSSNEIFEQMDNR
ncbi:MAG: hypothetical protein U9N55_02750 [candidate division Zixibacteria bacterium]|nr:hypothetical protein [candidate division Zixibacteria bacterium]